MTTMNNILSFFGLPNVVSAVGVGGYCKDCTTAEGLSGAQFCVGCKCRAGYGCTPSGVSASKRVNKSGSKFSNYTQQQLNEMAASIVDLEKKYNTAINKLVYAQEDYDSDLRQIARYVACGNGGAHGRYTKDGGDCSAANGDDRYATWVHSQGAYNRLMTAKSESTTAKNALEAAKTNYTNALAQFEREKVANMTPAEKAAYEKSKAEQARKDIAAANRMKIYKWLAIGGISLGVAGGLFWLGRKMFTKTASAA